MEEGGWGWSGWGEVGGGGVFFLADWRTGKRSGSYFPTVCFESDRESGDLSRVLCSLALAPSVYLFVCLSVCLSPSLLPFCIAVCLCGSISARVSHCLCISACISLVVSVRLHVAPQSSCLVYVHSTFFLGSYFLVFM